VPEANAVIAGTDAQVKLPNRIARTLYARRAASIVVWSPSGARNFRFAFSAFSRTLFGEKNTDSTDIKATMLQGGKGHTEEAWYNTYVGIMYVRVHMWDQGYCRT